MKYKVIENIEGFRKGDIFTEHHIERFLLTYDLKWSDVLGIYFERVEP